MTLPPIDRARADHILEGIKERAGAINARPALLHWVTGIRVFGDYLADKAELHRLDVVVELAHRTPPDGLSFSEASLAMADASGRQFSNVVQRVYYPERMVLQSIKNRSPYIFVTDSRAVIADDPKFRGRTILSFSPPSENDAAPHMGP